MSGYLLGVDGGGTFTEFCVAEETGAVLFSVFSGSASYKSVGREAALDHIRNGLEQIGDRGIAPAHIRMGVWGLSGCDTPEDQAAYEALLKDAGLGANHRVVNDAVLAFWAGAEPPGMVIIAGTGSIVMGFDGRGGIHRLGGWHYAFSDLGSGYWMGAQLLRETALWLEGCREEDPVFRKVCDNETPPAALCRLSNLTEGTEIAAFARLALEEDSPLCGEIRRQAAEYLAGYAAAMRKQIGADAKILLSGGLFRNDGFYNLVASRLGGEVLRQERSPALGGIRLVKQWMEKE